MAPQSQIEPDVFMQKLEENKETNEQELSDIEVIQLTRANLVLLAKHLGVSFSSGAPKHELQIPVIFHLGDHDLVSEKLVELADSVPRCVSLKDYENVGKETEVSSEAIELRKLELEQLRLEQDFKLKEELERLKLEQDFKLKEMQAQKEIELAKSEAHFREGEAAVKQAQAQAIARGQTHVPYSPAHEYMPSFNVTANVKLVPPFQEKDLDAYFSTFEHVALTCEWPRDKWTILLSTTLKGKAQVCYANLEPEAKQNYESVKIAILQTYELVPEKHRQNFRNQKRSGNQTWVEYCKDKERLFEKWTRSRNIGTMSEMKNLILLEEFRNQVPREIRVHLDDLDIQDVQKAAKRADDYAITHRLQTDDQPVLDKSQGHGKNGPKGKKRGQGDARVTNGTAQSSSQGSQHKRVGDDHGSDSHTWCQIHHSKTHNTAECRLYNNVQELKGQNPVSVAVNKTNNQKDKDRAQKPKHSDSSKSPVAFVMAHDRSHDVDSIHTLDALRESPRISNDESHFETVVSDGDLLEQCPVGTMNVDSRVETPDVVDPRLQAYVSPGIIAAASSNDTDSVFAATPSEGSTCTDSQWEARGVEIAVLRDTGCTQSLLLEGVVPFTNEHFTGDYVLVSGVSGHTMTVPLYTVVLKNRNLSPETQVIRVGVSSTLPINGVALLLGNDICEAASTSPEPTVSQSPTDNSSSEYLESKCSSCLPACVVTRAAQRKQSDKEADLEQSAQPQSVACDIDLSDTFLHGLLKDRDTNYDSTVRESIIQMQHDDPEVSALFDKAVDAEQAGKEWSCYIDQDGLLIRKWRCPLASKDDADATLCQVVAPSGLRPHLLSLAHDHPMSGHAGVRKTKSRLFQHFWWPGAAKDVAEYCRTCHVCQQVGKPNQTPIKAPLKPIPVMGEPFEDIMLDIVGPLPKTSKGFEYCLTILDMATRFPEAIALRKCTAQAVTDALIKYFSLFGLARTVRSDQGTHFTAKVISQSLKQLGIEQIFGCAYRPQTQGAIERFHGSLKTMIKTYVLENQKDWDVGLPLLLFAARSTVHEAHGFAPFDLVMAHHVRTPLQLVKEQCFEAGSQESDVLTYVSKMRTRLSNAVSVAQQNLRDTQSKMKGLYDVATELRSYECGDKVMVLLPTQGDSVHATLAGPYTVKERLDDYNYVVSTPDRKKSTQRCHINMMKTYHQRDKGSDKGLASPTPLPTCHSTPVTNIAMATVSEPQHNVSTDFEVNVEPIKLGNSDVLSNLQVKLAHLDTVKSEQMSSLIREYSDLFPDTPSRAVGMYHDVDVGETTPIKQHPYRVGPLKKGLMDEEIQYMLENEIIEPANSPWCSPCHLVPKADGSSRFVTDFRKVNAVTKTDSYPLPRIDSLIDEVAGAQFVTKLDLLKGYWQVPLTERAKDISAFSVGDSLYRYLVCPFGMKNSGCTFQRFMDLVVKGLHNTKVYVDDLIVYSSTWEEHLRNLRALFERLRQHRLTVSLVKSEFGHATVQYLGHVVGQGHILPVSSKVQAILGIPPPDSRKALARIIGMVGFYRKFCKNLASVMAPLTDLISPKAKFVWTEQCQEALDKIKRILTNAPLLVPPDYSREFRLYVDSCDDGAGAVLMQEDQDGIEHPICYYSKKYVKYQRNYSIVEKEALALLLAVKFFDVYLSSSPFPIQVYTDHNPLCFVQRMKNDNQRLLRWSLTLQEYNLVVNHVKGKDNVIADTLSRA